MKFEPSVHKILKDYQIKFCKGLRTRGINVPMHDPPQGCTSTPGVGLSVHIAKWAKLRGHVVITLVLVN